MKKKQKIKTIDDIKYCEENELTIYTKGGASYKFINNVWCYFNSDKKLVEYNTTVDCSESLYYEEEQELQEVDGKDIGKLCWFWDNDERFKKIRVLTSISETGRPYTDGIVYFHCRPLTKEEIKEFMEKAE